MLFVTSIYINKKKSIKMRHFDRFDSCLWKSAHDTSVLKLINLGVIIFFLLNLLEMGDLRLVLA
jgi:hypothetical protein